MAIGGSSGKRPMSSRGTHGGSAMTTANDSSTSSADARSATRVSTRSDSPAAAAFSPIRCAAAGLMSTQTNERGSRAIASSPM